MARLFRGEGRAIAFVVGVAFAQAALFAATARAQGLYDRPVLIVETGEHQARITTAAVDADGRFIVTGSTDKTLRIWSSQDGELLGTIRVPSGPDGNGWINSLAMSPNGDLVAVGGRTVEKRAENLYANIYLFD